MEKSPFKNRINNVTERLGRFVVGVDDDLDVYGDPEFDDTQEMDLSGLGVLLNEDHIIRGED